MSEKLIEMVSCRMTVANKDKVRKAAKKQKLRLSDLASNLILKGVAEINGEQK